VIAQGPDCSGPGGDSHRSVQCSVSSPGRWVESSAVVWRVVGKAAVASIMVQPSVSAKQAMVARDQQQGVEHSVHGTIAAMAAGAGVHRRARIDNHANPPPPPNYQLCQGDCRARGLKAKGGRSGRPR